MKTKIYLLTIITSIFFTSCSTEPSQKEIVKNKIETKIKSAMNDPASYEFASIELIDSTTNKINFEYTKSSLEMDLEFQEKQLKSDSIKYSQAEFESLKKIYKDGIDKYRPKVKNTKSELDKIEKIKQKLAENGELDKVVSYEYLFSFRGNNKLGAKVKNTVIVQITPAPEYEIFNLTTNKDEIILNPKSVF